MIHYLRGECFDEKARGHATRAAPELYYILSDGGPCRQRDGPNNVPVRFARRALFGRVPAAAQRKLR